MFVFPPPYRFLFNELRPWLVPPGIDERDQSLLETGLIEKFGRYVLTN
jgi:hypothetical protein